MLGKPNFGRCEVKVKLIILLAAAILFSLNLSQAESQEEEVFNLGQVVVSATKTEHTLADVPER